LQVGAPPGLPRGVRRLFIPGIQAGDFFILKLFMPLIIFAVLLYTFWKNFFSSVWVLKLLFFNGFIVLECEKREQKPNKKFTVVSI
jgi:hypothetical protein